MELEVIEFHFPHITVVKQRKDGSIVERYYFQKKYKRYANTRYFMVQDQLTVYMVDTIDCVDTQNVSVPIISIGARIGLTTLIKSFGK